MIFDKKKREDEIYEDGEYISIRKTWGKPENTEKEKKKRGEDESIEKEIPKKKAKIEIQKPTASQGVPEPWEQDLSGETNEKENIDWDKEIKTHKQSLEKEFEEKKDEIGKNEMKDNAWNLLRECITTYL